MGGGFARLLAGGGCPRMRVRIRRPARVSPILHRSGCAARYGGPHSTVSESIPRPSSPAAQASRGGEVLLRCRRGSGPGQRPHIVLEGNPE
jgi:hypothetical protein